MEPKHGDGWQVRRTMMGLEAESGVAADVGGKYVGWPSIARTADGRLVSAFSGDREGHVCPYGKTQLVWSDDGGRSWTLPETITDTVCDDRDAGIVSLRSGVLLVTWFSTAPDRSLGLGQWASEDVRARWGEHAERVTREAGGPEAVREKVGYWLRRSADGGRTWDEPIRTPLSTPKGPIELSDGRLLYVGRTWDLAGTGEERAHVVAESGDEGRTWGVIWRCPLTVKEDIEGGVGEPHAVEMPDGRIVMLVRHTGHEGMYQMESEDGGHTWSQARLTPMKGYPPHLLRLSDGRLLCVYGYRFEPYGQRACLSGDGGRTWDIGNEIVLRADGPTWDLGYPGSVETEDGRVVTVYYQAEAGGEGEPKKPCLQYTRWAPPPSGAVVLAGRGNSGLDLGEERVIAEGPPEERRWGFWQFPWFVRKEAGDWLATFKIGDDSHDHAGEQHPFRLYRSGDNGATWEAAGESATAPLAEVRLRDGTVLAAEYWDRISASELGVGPVAEGVPISPGYGCAHDVYAVDDLPIERQGARMRRRVGGDEESFVARVEVPGATCRAFRETNTSSGRVALPGHIDGRLAPLRFHEWEKRCVELDDGTLLYAAEIERMNALGELLPGRCQAYCLASTDGGRTWGVRGTIAYEPRRVPRGFHELAMTRTAGGVLVCAMRTELGGSEARDLWVARSWDGGVEWEPPRIVSRFGVEPVLLTLANGATVLSYGRPGVEVRVSRDGQGGKWSDPVAVRDQNALGMATTCGYTRLAATGPDRFVVIYSDFFHRDDRWVLHKAIKAREIVVR